MGSIWKADYIGDKKMQASIFRRAYELITKKTCGEMTDEERELVSLATSFVATQLPKAYPKEMTISEGLLLLAQIAEVITERKGVIDCPKDRNETHWDRLELERRLGK